MLELRAVSKSFAGRLVLQPTSLTIQPAQTTVLIGPSGCGKSTLLRLILGLIEPDAGSVLLDGVEVTVANVLEVRRRMGYVLQDGGLFPHLTAEENVALLTRYLRWPRVRITDRIAELAQLTQFPKDALERYPGQLSGGQRQRVGLMRALMLDPAVVLLDEPMAALDPMIRYGLQEDLKRIFLALRKTVVLVTHDMAEAAFFGDIVVLLHEGRIVQQGTIADMIRTPAEPFVRQFLQAQRVSER